MLHRVQSKIKLLAFVVGDSQNHGSSTNNGSPYSPQIRGEGVEFDESDGKIAHPNESPEERGSQFVLLRQH